MSTLEDSATSRRSRRRGRAITLDPSVLGTRKLDPLTSTVEMALRDQTSTVK